MQFIRTSTHSMQASQPLPCGCKITRECHTAPDKKPDERAMRSQLLQAIENAATAHVCPDGQRNKYGA